MPQPHSLHHAMTVKDIDNIVSEYGLPFFLECLALWAEGEKTSDGGAQESGMSQAGLAVLDQLAASARKVKDAADQSQEF